MQRIDRCRVCGHQELEPVLSLGELALTGVFIKKGADVPAFDISLSMCGNEKCGLVQLNEVYDQSLLYGDHYGYASRLNSSMVNHLREKARLLQEMVPLSAGSIVVDIGSNDATTLSFFPQATKRIGVDATGKKFENSYREIGAELVPEFFPSNTLSRQMMGQKAALVSSYSCFYDLPDPLAFAQGISEILASEGVWCLEQSYMPAMLRTNSFDTVCHEHIEYYKLKDIKNICDRVGLKICDVEFNDINGGSFSLIVCHESSSRPVSLKVSEILSEEERTDWREEFKRFRERITVCKDRLRGLLDEIGAQGKRVSGIGASTKGNVLLQYYGITGAHLDCIGEVNHEKYGCQTPGTAIEILREDDVLSSDPDFLLVLPWHFRKFFVESPKFRGRRLIFPLPQVEVVDV